MTWTYENNTKKLTYTDGDFNIEFTVTNNAGLTEDFTSQEPLNESVGITFDGTECKVTKGTYSSITITNLKGETKITIGEYVSVQTLTGGTGNDTFIINGTVKTVNTGSTGTDTVEISQSANSATGTNISGGETKKIIIANTDDNSNDIVLNITDILDTDENGKPNTTIEFKEDIEGTQVKFAEGDDSTLVITYNDSKTITLTADINTPLINGTGTQETTFGALADCEWYYVAYYLDDTDSLPSMVYGRKDWDTENLGYGAEIVVQGFALDENASDEEKTAFVTAWNDNFNVSNGKLTLKAQSDDKQITFFNTESTDANIFVGCADKYIVSWSSGDGNDSGWTYDSDEKTATYLSGSSNFNVTESNDETLISGAITQAYEITADSEGTADDPFSVTVSGFAEGTTQEQISSAFGSITPDATESTIILTQAALDLMDSSTGFSIDESTTGNWSFELFSESVSYDNLNTESGAPSYSIEDNLATVKKSGSVPGYQIFGTNKTKSNQVIKITSQDTADVVNEAEGKNVGDQGYITFSEGEDVCTISGVSASAAESGTLDATALTANSITIPKDFAGSSALVIALDSTYVTSTLTKTTEDKTTVEPMTFNLSNLNAGYTVKVNSANINLIVGNNAGTIQLVEGYNTKINGTPSGVMTYDFTDNDDNTDGTTTLEIASLRDGDIIKLHTAATICTKDEDTLTLGDVIIKATSGGTISDSAYVQIGDDADTKVALSTYLEGTKTAAWEITEDAEGGIAFKEGDTSYIVIKGVTVAEENLSDVPTPVLDETSGYYEVDLSSIASGESITIFAGNDSTRKYALTLVNTATDLGNTETDITINPTDITINRGNVSISGSATSGITVESTTSNSEGEYEKISNVVINTNNTGSDTITIGTYVENVTITGGGGADFIRMNNDSITLTDANESNIISISNLDSLTDSNITWNNTTKILTLGAKSIYLPNEDFENRDALRVSDKWQSLKFTSYQTADEAVGNYKTLSEIIYPALSGGVTFTWTEDTPSTDEDTKSFILTINDADESELATLTGLASTVTADLLNNLKIITEVTGGYQVNLTDSLLAALTDSTSSITLTLNEGYENPLGSKKLSLDVSGVNKANDVITAENGEWKLEGKNAIWYTKGNVGDAGYAVTHKETDAEHYGAETYSVAYYAAATPVVTLTNFVQDEQLAQMKFNILTTQSAPTSTDSITISSQAISDNTKIFAANGVTVQLTGNETVEIDSDTNKATITGADSVSDTITVNFEGREDYTEFIALQVEGNGGADTFNLSNISGGNKVNVYGGTSTTEDKDNDTFNIGNNVTGVEIHSGNEDADTFVFTGTNSDLTVNLGASDVISLGADLSGANITFSNGKLNIGSNTVAVKYIYGTETKNATEETFKAGGSLQNLIVKTDTDTEGKAIKDVIGSMATPSGSWRIENGSLIFHGMGGTATVTEADIITITGLKTLTDAKITQAFSGNNSINVENYITYDEASSTVKLSNALLGTEETTVALDTNSAADFNLGRIDTDKTNAEPVAATWEIEDDTTNSTGTVKYTGTYNSEYYTVASNKESIAVHASTKSNAASFQITGLAMTTAGNNPLQLKTANDATSGVKGIAFDTANNKITIGAYALQSNQNVSVSVSNTKTDDETNYTLALATADSDGANKVTASTKTKDKTEIVDSQTSGKKDVNYYAEKYTQGFIVEDNTIKYKLETSSATIAVKNCPSNVTQDAVTFNSATKTVTLTEAALSQDDSVSISNINWNVVFAGNIGSTVVAAGWSIDGDSVVRYDQEGYTVGWYKKLDNSGKWGGTIGYHATAQTATQQIKITGLTFADGADDTTKLDAIKDATAGIQIDDNKYTIPTKFRTASTGNNLTIESRDTNNVYTVEFESAELTAYPVNVTLKSANISVTGTTDADTITIDSTVTTLDKAVTFDGNEGNDNINIANDNATISVSAAVVIKGGDSEQATAENTITLKNVETTGEGSVVIQDSGGVDNINLTNTKGISVVSGQQQDVINISGGEKNTIDTGAAGSQNTIKLSGTASAVIQNLDKTSGTVTIEVTDVELTKGKVSFTADGRLKLGDNITLDVGTYDNKSALTAAIGSLNIKSQNDNTGQNLLTLLEEESTVALNWEFSNGQYIGTLDSNAIITITGGLSNDTEQIQQATVTNLNTNVTLDADNKIVFNSNFLDSLTSSVTYSLADSQYSVSLPEEQNTDAAWNFSESGSTTATFNAAGKISYSDNESTITVTKTGGDAQIVLSGLKESEEAPNWENVAANGTFSVPDTKLPENKADVVTVSTNAGYNVSFDNNSNGANVEVTSVPSSDATITGSAKDDTVNVNFAEGIELDKTYTITTGEGIDSIKVSAATIKSGGELSIVGGAGADSIDISGSVSMSGGKIIVDGSNTEEGDKVTIKGVAFTADSSETISVTGGTGADEFDISLAANENDSVTISGGDGADKATLEGTGITFILGKGADQVTVQGASTSGIMIDASEAETDASDKIYVNNGTGISISSGSGDSDEIHLASGTAVSISGLDSSDSIHVDDGFNTVSFDTANKALVFTNSESQSITVSVASAENEDAFKSGGTMSTVKVVVGASEAKDISTLFDNQEIKWRIFTEDSKKYLTYGDNISSSNNYQLIKISNLALGNVDESTLATKISLKAYNDQKEDITNNSEATPAYYKVVFTTDSSGLIGENNTSAKPVTMSFKEDGTTYTESNTSFDVSALNLKAHSVAAKWTLIDPTATTNSQEEQNGDTSDPETSTGDTTKTVTYTSAYTQAGYVIGNTEISYDESTTEDSKYGFKITGLTGNVEITGDAIPTGWGAIYETETTDNADPDDDSNSNGNTTVDDTTNNAKIIGAKITETSIRDTEGTDEVTVSITTTAESGNDDTVYTIQFKDNVTMANKKDPLWSFADATSTGQNEGDNGQETSGNSDGKTENTDDTAAASKTLVYSIGGLEKGYYYKSGETIFTEITTTKPTTIVYDNDGVENTAAFSMTGIASTFDTTNAASKITVTDNTVKINDKSILAGEDVQINKSGETAYEFSEGITGDDTNKSWSQDATTKTIAEYRGEESYKLNDGDKTKLTYEAGTLYYSITGLDAGKLSSELSSPDGFIAITETATAGEEITTVKVDLATLAADTPVSNTKIELVLPAGATNADKYTLAPSDNNSLVSDIDDAFKVSEEDNKTISYITGAKSAGWTASKYVAAQNDDQATNAALIYSEAVPGSELFTISGLNNATTTTGEAPDAVTTVSSDIQIVKDVNQKITGVSIKKELIGTYSEEIKVTGKNASDTYTITVTDMTDDDLSNDNGTTWTTSTESSGSKTVTYTTGVTTVGYVLHSNDSGTTLEESTAAASSITYNDTVSGGTKAFDITGLQGTLTRKTVTAGGETPDSGDNSGNSSGNTASGDNTTPTEDTTLAYNEITLDENQHTITIASSAIGTSITADITVEVKNVAQADQGSEQTTYTLKLADSPTMSTQQNYQFTNATVEGTSGKPNTTTITYMFDYSAGYAYLDAQDNRITDNTENGGASIVYYYQDQEGQTEFTLTGLKESVTISQKPGETTYTSTPPGITFDPSTNKITFTSKDVLAGTVVELTKGDGVTTDYELVLGGDTSWAQTDTNPSWNVEPEDEDTTAAKTVTYYGAGKTAGYKLEGTTKITVTADAVAGNEIFKITGLKGDVTKKADGTPSNLTFSESASTVTITSAALGTLSANEAVTITKIASDDEDQGTYTLKLATGDDNDFTVSSETKAWSAESGTLYYKSGGKSAGLELTNGNNVVASTAAFTTITQIDAVAPTTEEFSITGIKADATVNSETGVSGIALNENGVITISDTTNLADKENIVLITSGNYTLTSNLTPPHAAASETWEVNTEKTSVTYYDIGMTDGYTLVTDGDNANKQITYSDATPGKELFHITGLTGVTAADENINPPTGISVADDCTVTVPATLLGTGTTTTNVEITGSKPAAEVGGAATTYKMKLSGDAVTLSEETTLWTLAGGKLTYNTGGASAGFVLQDGTNQVSDSTTAVTSITYTESNTASTPAFNITGLNLAEIKDGKETGLSPAEGITLNAVTSTVTISSASVIPKTDKTTVTIDNDYKLAIDQITLPEPKDAENNTFNVDANNTVTYYAPGQTEGYTLENNIITYSAATQGDAIFTISGLQGASLESATAVASVNGITVNAADKSIAISTTTIGTSTSEDVEVTVSNGYTLKLADTANASTAKAAEWDTTSTAGTAVYKTGGYTAGYAVLDDDDNRLANQTDAGSKLIHYKDETPNAAALTITGLADNFSITTDAEGNFTIPEGFTVNHEAHTVKISNTELLAGKNVEITTGDYTFVDGGLEGETSTAPELKVDSSDKTKVHYEAAGGTSEGYTVSNDNKKQLTYNQAIPGEEIFTINNLNNVVISEEGALSGDEAKIKVTEEKGVYTITISDDTVLDATDAENKDGATLTLPTGATIGNYKFVLSNGEYTALGTADSTNSKVGNYFTLDSEAGTVQYMTGAHTAGYQVNEASGTNAASITYEESSTGTAAVTINGLKVDSLSTTSTSGVDVVTENKFELDENKNIVIKDNTLLNNEAPTVTGEGYGIKLENEVTSSKGTSFWAVDSGKLNFYDNVTTAAYTNNQAEGGTTYSITYTPADKGDATYTLSGIATTGTPLANYTADSTADGAITTEGFATVDTATSKLIINNNRIVIGDASYLPESPVAGTKIQVVNVPDKDDTDTESTAVEGYSVKLATSVDAIQLLLQSDDSHKIDNYLTVEETKDGEDGNSTKALVLKTGAKKAGWTEDAEYKATDSGTTLFTITGINTSSNKLVNDAEDSDGISKVAATVATVTKGNDGKYTVEISADLIDTTAETPSNITLEFEGEQSADYTLKFLGSAQDTRTKWAEHFEIGDDNNDTVVYKAEGTTAGYFVPDPAGTEITYNPASAGDTQFTISGINTEKLTGGTTEQPVLESLIKFDEANSKIIIASEVIVSNVTVENEENATTKIDGDWKFEVTGGSEPQIKGQEFDTTSSQDGTIYYKEIYSVGFVPVAGADNEDGLPSIQYTADGASETAITFTGATIDKQLTAKSFAEALTNGTLKLGKSILDYIKATEENSFTIESDKYTVSLDDTSKITAEGEKWTIGDQDTENNTGKVVYTEAREAAGWNIETDSENANMHTITGHSAKGGNVLTISGLTESVKLNSRKYVTGITIADANGATSALTGEEFNVSNDMTRVVTVSKSLLADGKDISIAITDSNGKEITNASEGENYSYILDTDALQAVDRTTEYWTADTIETNNTKISYHSIKKDSKTVQTHGYTLSEDKHTLSYNTVEGAAYFTLEGLKSAAATKIKDGVVTEGQIEDGIIFTGVTQGTDESGESNNTFTIASNIIGTGGVTITTAQDSAKFDADSNMAFALGGKGKLVYGDTQSQAVSLFGSAGNDTIVNSSSAVVTIDGGRGNDSIDVGTAGAVIYGGGGNDTIKLAESKNSTIHYDSGKVVIEGFKSVNDKEQDVLSLGEEVKVTKSSWTSKDGGLVLTLGSVSNTITFKGLEETDKVQIGTGNNASVYAGNFVYNTDNTKMTINQGFTGTEVTLDDGVTEFDGTAGKKGLTITGNDIGNTITGSAKADKITAGKGDNKLIGGNGNDTLIAGDNANTLYGGDGKDLFVIGAGNASLDYAKGDKISLNGDDTVIADAATVKDGGIILTIGEKQTITVGGATEDTGIVINGETRYFGDHAFYDSKKKGVTLGGAFSEKSYSAADKAALVSISAENLTNEGISITGNAKNNVITASGQGDTIDGGKGNDTLFGGDGEDVFIYNAGEGKDVIKNYNGEKDTLTLTNGESKGIAAITTASLKGANSVAIKVGTQVLTVEYDEGADVGAINLGEETTITIGNNCYLTDDNEVVMFSAFKGTFDATKSASKATEIDASAATGAVKIQGNNSASTIKGGGKADSLVGGTQDDSLVGGAGNDTLFGNAGDDTLTGDAGRDIFVYDGNGDDVITDYVSGEDKIRLADKSLTVSEVNYSADGNDVIFTVGNGTLTVKNAEGSNITMIVGGKTRTTNYTKPAEEEANGDVYDLLYDNNFSNDEFGIDDISEVKADKYSVGDVKTDTNANLVPDQNAITYGEDDNK